MSSSGLKVGHTLEGSSSVWGSVGSLLPCALDLWLPGLSALLTSAPHPHGI